MQAIPVRHIKPAIKEPDVLGNLVIWNVRDLLSGKDMVQDLHRHSFYFLLIIERGFGEHIIDFTPYPMVDGSVYLMRPGQVHELKLQSDCEGYLLQFTDQFQLNSDVVARQILKKVARKNYYLPDAAAGKKLLALMGTIYQESREKKDRYELAIQLNLQLLLVELLRQAQEPADTPDEKISYQLERLEEYRELIAEHISSQKQVHWYAETMRLTTYQLNTITKTVLGKPSSSLINDYILLEAKRYLLATTNQVNQISWHLGYEDVSYFIRFFKKHMGYSPEAFRKQFT
jgi:AraC-like DNA-binding protein